MFVHVKTKVDEKLCRTFILDGAKFIVLPNAHIFHYDSGSPWEHNGKYDNGRRSEKVLRMEHEASTPWKRAETIGKLRKLPKIN